MILIPIIEDYFIAAQKNSEFIGRLIEEIILVLTYPKSFQNSWEKIQMNNAKMIFSSQKIHGKDIYNEYFKLACQRVLVKKQN